MVYRDCRIGEIRIGKGNARVELRVSGGEHNLREADAWGDVDAAADQRGWRRDPGRPAIEACDGYGGRRVRISRFANAGYKK